MAAKNRVLMGVAVLVLVLMSNAQNTNSKSRSPDGRYIIENRDEDNHEPAHSLTLLKIDDGSEVKIFEYRRHIDVLWSPLSDAFVINDYEASDSSHPVLFLVRSYSRPIDLRAELLKFLRSKGEESHLVGNQHAYIVARRWIDRHRNPLSFNRIWRFESTG